MRKAIAIVALTLSCLGLVSAAEKCRDVQLQENFDAAQYLGVWYQQARDSTMR